MALIIISFFAGILTILAPCVLPILPVVLGASAEKPKNKLTPYIVVGSLCFSIILFSILLKATIYFISVDPIVWKLFSGIILIVFGLFIIFPNLWKKISDKLGFSNGSNKLLTKSGQKSGILGTVLVGISLGPVFSSCSPIYSFILSTLLPASFLFGLVNLISYAFGLSSILLIIAILGQKFISKIKFVVNPNGWFKKILGILFLLIGIFIITGFDKVIEIKILDAGYFDTTKIEQNILDKVEINN